MPVEPIKNSKDTRVNNIINPSIHYHLCSFKPESVSSS
ncbi:hypothetical protein F383_12733 [Gossypium arboreum]|uniref:Uncharacterized protein n=1 Tax=Gossypium arboreum TaxID=29729 RepID=A0A0B0NCY3_GOSAR|nr:hypothetical protein F383_12733 [Gossypium arboreum]